MMKEYSELRGTKGHLTSRTLMTPKNKPDTCEKEVLQKIEITQRPIYVKNSIFFNILYDIGKISTYDSILLRPVCLNKLEYEIIKDYVAVSHELLSSVDIYKARKNVTTAIKVASNKFHVEIVKE